MGKLGCFFAEVVLLTYLKSRMTSADVLNLLKIAGVIGSLLFLKFPADHEFFETRHLIRGKNHAIDPENNIMYVIILRQLVSALRGTSGSISSRDPQI